MKNRYAKLKWKDIARDLLISILAVAVVYFILIFLTEGIPEDVFQRAVLKIFEGLGMTQELAAARYSRLFTEEREILLLAVFCIMLFIFLLISICKMARYLNSISEALDTFMEDGREEPDLPEELEQTQEQLNLLYRRQTGLGRIESEDEHQRKELAVCLTRDLKTPLSSVTSCLTALDSHPDMPENERVRYTHNALKKTIRLEKLINEYAGITRFSVRENMSEKRETNIADMLERLRNEGSGMLNSKNMTCNLDIRGALIINADQKRLYTVFDILYRNAVIYGYEGSEILIEGRRGEGGITVVFTDEGPQIPQKKLETIFESFYRVDNGDQAEGESTLHGLAMAKQIVEMHGGAMSALSDSKTTRFIVNIPADPQMAKRRTK